ncbi:MAG TPA: agmatinase [Bacteroidales bacterium]|nr:agmatinase [Bacteroidales bacterium]HOX76454.1 agmatinase [Bacteroidales bacterium]HPM92686.1 agmatinase [Bacteroidales bacterium]
MNFGGIPAELSGYEVSPIVILPVPFDATSTWIKGADRGPDAILEASANMELYDIETDSEVYLKGIFTAEPVIEENSPENLAVKVKKSISRFLDDGKFVVTLGGEHSVTIGAVQAFAERFPGLHVLQIDAHTDLRPEYEGSRFNHACVMSRVRELCPIVQVGIRSMDVVEKPFVDKGRIFYAKDIAGSGNNWIDRVIELLGDQVYITIDLDGFDPSVLPATGTPEPGGLNYYEVLHLVRKLINTRKVVGFDVVELCPIVDNKASDFLASKLIYQMLSYQFVNQ